MAYRPPSSSSSSSSSSSKYPPASDPFPMNRRKNTTDEGGDGWHTISRSFHSSRIPAAQQSATHIPHPSQFLGRWGQSALQKPAQKPKTHEEEFPVLGTKTPSSTSLSSMTSPISRTASPGFSMAERMKTKLIEEEEAQRVRTELERRKAAETDKDRIEMQGFIPMLSILHSRHIQNKFENGPQYGADLHNSDYDEDVDGDDEFEDTPEYENYDDPDNHDEWVQSGDRR